MAHKATAVEATARGVMPAEGAAMDPAKRAKLRAGLLGLKRVAVPRVARVLEW